MDDLRDCKKCGSENIFIDQTHRRNYGSDDYWFYCGDCDNQGSMWSTVKGARVCWNAENMPKRNPYVEEVLWCASAVDRP